VADRALGESNNNGKGESMFDREGRFLEDRSHCAPDEELREHPSRFDRELDTYRGEDLDPYEEAAGGMSPQEEMEFRATIGRSTAPLQADPFDFQDSDPLPPLPPDPSEE
jgi:hypothetical protein